MDDYRAKNYAGKKEAVCFGCGCVIPCPTPNQREAIRPQCGSIACYRKVRNAAKRARRIRGPRRVPKLKYFSRM